MLTLGMKHGIIMMVGFGLLMPMGAIAAKLLKHRPNDLWFRWHRTLQILGLLISIIGFAIAILNFNVFTEEKGTIFYSHGCLGVTAMVLALLQPINAFFRPPKNPADTSGVVDETYGNASRRVKANRWKWEYAHKCFGYMALLFGAISIMLAVSWEGRAFQLGYYVGVLGFLVLFAAYCTYDRFSYQAPNNGVSETEVAGSVV